MRRETRFRAPSRIRSAPPLPFAPSTLNPRPSTLRRARPRRQTSQARPVGLGDCHRLAQLGAYPGLFPRPEAGWPDPGGEDCRDQPAGPDHPLSGLACGLTGDGSIFTRRKGRKEGRETHCGRTWELQIVNCKVKTANWGAGESIADESKAPSFSFNSLTANSPAFDSSAFRSSAPGFACLLPSRRFAGKLAPTKHG